MPGHNQPRFAVSLGGRDLTARFDPLLVSLSLTEKRSAEADQLDITLQDHAGQLDIPREGETIAFSLGWESGPDVLPGLIDKGLFRVDEAEFSGPPDIITIRGRSANLTGAARIRREGGWQGTTLGDVLADIARRNGLTLQLAAELAARAIPVLAQDQRSDVALLRWLGERFDALATVKKGILLFAPIGSGRSAQGSPIAPVSITRGAGDKFRYSRAERDSYGGVEARYHDQDAAERKTVKRGRPSEKAGPARRLRKTYPNKTEAEQAAEAEDRRVQRAAASFDMTLALGRADLFPDRKVTLAGFKPEIDGMKWQVAEVTHKLDAGGFSTGLKLEAAG